LRHLAASRRIRLTRRVCFFGVIDVWLLQAAELFVRREEGERMLVELLRDETHWRGLFRVEPIELAEVGRN